MHTNYTNRMQIFLIGIISMYSYSSIAYMYVQYP